MTDDDIVAEAIDGVFVPRAQPSVAGVTLDGESVLYDEASSGLHLLNPTASVVWACCDGGGTVNEIVADIAEAFAEPNEVVRNDVLETLRSFGRAGLLVGVAAEVASGV